jgi:hypothetical protein
MPTTVTEQKPRAKDLLAQMGPNVYRAAYEKGMSLSAFLEFQDPSAEYKDNLDAFGRLLQVADIRTKTLPEWGVYASTYEDFMKTPEQRALVPEWIHREWRGVQTGKSPNTRALLLSGDGILGGWERPYADAQMPRWSQRIAPAIPVSELVAITTPIDSDVYRSAYLQYVAADSRLVRVGEGAEIPRVTLAVTDRTVNLYKYGRALEASYESLRRQRVDKLALFIAQMAAQSETDKVAVVLDIIVNGDGNSGTAATNYNLTTLDTAATAGTLTLKGWLAFKLKFANPYAITTALTQEAGALQAMLLNVGTANTPLVNIQAAAGFGGFQQINPGLRDNVALGWTSDAPALTIVGFDRRYAVERVIETGSNISEIERFVIKQTQVLTMTETEGYAILDANAVKTLSINA